MKQASSLSPQVSSGISKETITNKLFNKYAIVQRDVKKQNWEISRKVDHCEISQSTQPNHDARIILCKYYELKYGVKIVNLKDFEDLEKFNSFIKARKEDKKLFKIGVILPAVFFDDRPSISGRSHANPILFERSEDGVLSAINLDCISVLRDDQQALSDKMMLPADIKLHPKNSNILDVNSCRTYAISILKDALRIDDLRAKLMDEVEETKEEEGVNIASFKYEKLPSELLKFTQTESSIAGAGLSAPIIRSKLSKENVSLAQRRGRDSETVFRKLEQDEWELGEDEETWESKTRNSALWNKSIANVERVKTVLDYYEINSEEALDELVRRLYQEQKDGLSSANILDNIQQINHFGTSQITALEEKSNNPKASTTSESSHQLTHLSKPKLSDPMIL